MELAGHGRSGGTLSTDLSLTRSNPQDAQDCTSWRKTNAAVPGNIAIKRRGFQLVKSILHLATTKQYQKFV